MSPRTANAVVLAGVFALIALSFLRFMDKPLASDDHYFLSPTVSANPMAFFRRNILEPVPDAGFLRPLPMFTFVIDSRLRDTIPHFPNYVNIILHLLNVALVGLLIAMPFRAVGLRSGVWAPAVGMLLFGLHPQNTGAVCWVAARFELLCAAFGTAGLCLWFAGTCRPHGRRWRIGAVICFVLSLLSKETGVVFPASVFVWELWRLLRHIRSIGIVRQLVTLSSLAAVLALYFLYRKMVFGGIGGYSTSAFMLFSPMSMAAWALVMLWPLATLAAPAQMLTWLLILAVLVAVFMLRRPLEPQSRACPRPWLLPIFVVAAWLFLMGWFPMTFVAVFQHVESRYSYVPLVAVCVIVGWTVHGMASSRILTMMTKAALAVLLALFVVVQQSEIGKWKDSGMIAQDIVEQTAALVPAPTPNATMFFPDVPPYDKPVYHIFDNGLQEALDHRYRRSDLTVTIWSDENALASRPANSYIFRWDGENRRMSLTHRPD